MYRFPTLVGDKVALLSSTWWQMMVVGWVVEWWRRGWNWRLFDDVREIFLPSDDHQVPYEAESGGQINEARIWKSLEIFYSLEFQSRMTKIKRTTKFYRQIDKKQINEKQIILSYTWEKFGDLLFLVFQSRMICFSQKFLSSLDEEEEEKMRWGWGMSSPSSFRHLPPPHIVNFVCKND